MELSKKNNFDISKNIVFNPNTPYSFKNPFSYEVSFSCRVSSPSAQNLFGKVTKGSVSLNGKNIPPEGLNLIVNNGDRLSIHASKLASASITNQGKNVVNAKCTLSLNLKENLDSIFIEDIEKNYNKFLEIRKTLNLDLGFKINKDKFSHEIDNDKDKFVSLKFLA